MDIDIGFWLSLALLVTVAIWVIDKVFKLKQKGGRVEGAVETSNSLISVFFVVLSFAPLSSSRLPSPPVPCCPPCRYTTSSW